MATSGWYLTKKGWNLLVKVGAGTASLTLTKILVGAGTPAEDKDLQRMTELVTPKAQGTSTTPVVDGTSISLTVEYRNDLNNGLTEGFTLTELGLYALDPDEGELLLFYGYLGGGQWINAYDEETNVVEVRRYPITMVFDTETGVTVCYPQTAYMTAEDVLEYCTVTVLPVFRTELQAMVTEHNSDSTAHADIRSTITNLSMTEQLRWASLTKNVSGSSYTEDFSTLDGLTVTGVWNVTEGRIEF